MEELVCDLVDGSSNGDHKETNPRESRQKTIECCIQSLVHACQCRDANCRLPRCQKMKRVLQHVKNCRKKTNAGCPCPICKQLIALCCYHAKNICQEANCPVPFCLCIKQKIRQKETEGSAEEQPNLELNNSKEDFGLYVICFNKEGHSDKMEELGCDLDDGSSTGDHKETNPQESHQKSTVLAHAYQCSDANCRLPSCKEMKRAVHYAKSCKRDINGGCVVCKQLFDLCGYHAKHCQEAECPVPSCLDVKHKLRRLEQHLQEGETLMGRTATMQNIGLPGSVPQPSPGNSNSSSQPSPSAPPHTSSQPPQPGIGVKPATGPLVAAAAWTFIQEQPHQPPQPHQMGLRQPNQLIGPGGVSNAIGNPGAPVRPTQALHQLLKVLKSPSSPQRQQQVLHILKSNPPLRAAFIKHRTAQLQQRQQQQQQQQQELMISEGNIIGPPPTLGQVQQSWYQRQQQQ